ncbi:MAG: helix-turn-helix domain-containing protein [SAR202 cluster bacterium]|nr:helix-turn-helix domain-containing protein [SAR202 cluster bacterium]
MNERLQLVTLFQTGSYTVAELAQWFQVSRKTAYKWLGRFARKGSVKRPAKLD